MSDPETEDATVRTELTPSEAFGLLSHENRIAALQALWRAGEPLRFTELADRAGITDTGNFNYHLGQLEEAFLRREDEFYALTRAGRQAMTVVLAGDFTDRPALTPTRLDRYCPYCGAEVALAHYGDKLRVLCAGCEGTLRDDRPGQPPDHLPSMGIVTSLPFPAAGVRDRDPRSLLRAGLDRTSSRWRQVTNGLCPDCGGTSDSTAAICSDHDPDGVCDTCGSRFVGGRTVVCEVCGQRHDGTFSLNAVAHLETVSHFRDDGVDLFDPTWEAARRLLDCEERVHSVDPVDAEVVWTVDGRSLRMRIGADGRVTGVRRGSRS